MLKAQPRSQSRARVSGCMEGRGLGVVSLLCGLGNRGPVPLKSISPDTPASGFYRGSAVCAQEINTLASLTFFLQGILIAFLTPEL